MTTREEHIQWCKDRAFEEFKFYVIRDGLLPAIRNGMTSMASDLRKHPDTNQPAMILLCLSQQRVTKTEHQFKEFINGFN